MTGSDPFDQWAIVEMLGHRRVIGRVTEQGIAGAGFIRIDTPDDDGGTIQSQIVAPASIYAITPISEEAARVAARVQIREPITVWDLPEDLRRAIHAAQLPERTDGYDDEFTDDEVPL
jgi:hypothetical protein